MWFVDKLGPAPRAASQGNAPGAGAGPAPSAKRAAPPPKAAAKAAPPPEDKKKKKGWF